MSKVTVYRFRVYDAQNGEMITSHRWGTRQAIERFARGEVLESTATEVEASVVTSNIQGLTERNFDPQMRMSGLQTQLTYFFGWTYGT